MAQIDPTVIKRLVETALLTVSGSVIPSAGVLVPGDPQPDGLTRWARLVSIDLAAAERPRSGAGQDEPDHADVTVTISCGAAVQRMRENRAALSCVMAEVARVLGQATLTDAGTGHQLDVMECRIITDREIDEQRRAATGAVILDGTVTRLTGTSVLALGTP